MTTTPRDNDAAATAAAAPTGESPARLKRPLIQLAKACGVATSYIDQVGNYVEIRDEVIISVLGSLGIDASTPAAVCQSLLDVECHGHQQLIAPTILKVQGRPTVITLNCAKDELTAITIALEDGTSYRGELAICEVWQSGAIDAQLAVTLPEDLPIGYHTVSVQAGGVRRTSTLIVAPPRIELPEAIQHKQRWGWMTQLYSVRSAQSWGVGDYGDLKRLLRDAGERSGADFMLINPIHASAPIPPLEPSPYLPESRRFLNVTYIRPQDIPEYAQLPESERAAVDALHESVAAANDSAEPLDLNASWSAKRQALRIIFNQKRSHEREEAFAAFKQRAGADLDAFVTWCVAFETWGAPWEGQWFTHESKSSPRVAALVREHHDDLEFERWMQWIADEQVGAAQQAAKDAGMAIGLMQDMAVGVHALGADVWWNPERFAKGATVGAPPDSYNQQGQDWGQPPFSPRHLEETGYKVYRDLVRTAFAHAGAVRIDHVLGLFRLWWIPQGHGAADGTYVTYDHEVMLSILAIEATRANGVVIGEDLGTVPKYVSRILAEHGVLGTVVEWFTRVDDSPNAGDPYAMPATYRKGALASVTVHDLPPTAGYLEGEHVRLREQLGVLTESGDEAAAALNAERRAMLDTLVEGEWLDAHIADDYAKAAEANTADSLDYEQQVVEAMHRALTTAPSVLLQAALVDGVGDRRIQNQPGTSWQYANWRIPLCDHDGQVVHTDHVFDLPRVQSLSAIMRGE
ncbi:4-alpha-glucanotransferase [Bifidobacterium goeldii]|uniref:4-alpha-glucanotransferase n=1 Tax=Bifidobacterium goeldii TaxID=2306975 RepID=A0A430FET5_9BIFI|nr:4-alpha-glucanotransferase [Bifidobacterium goeldii]RSX51320.1 4-alpha-glucanotransferase [Bifidobacterium goeldii]